MPLQPVFLHASRYPGFLIEPQALHVMFEITMQIRFPSWASIIGGLLGAAAASLAGVLVFWLFCAAALLVLAAMAGR